VHTTAVEVVRPGAPSSDPQRNGTLTVNRMTRRRMLQGTGAALLGAGLLGIAARQAAADDTALDAPRAAALSALLAALAHGPAPGLDTAAYRGAFDAYYAVAHEPFRRYADDGLDALSAETAFMLAPPAEAAALMQGWAAEPGHQLLVSRALELGSLSFDEEEEFRSAGLALVTGGMA
jgi:hypothetical protein